MIIKQWIPEIQQEMLFDHTKRLRESIAIVDSSIDLKEEKVKSSSEISK